MLCHTIGRRKQPNVRVHVAVELATSLTTAAGAGAAPFDDAHVELEEVATGGLTNGEKERCPLTFLWVSVWECVRVKRGKQNFVAPCCITGPCVRLRITMEFGFCRRII